MIGFTRSWLLALVCMTWMVSLSPAQGAEMPTLVFSTYLGGSGEDYAQDIAVDAQGYIYVTGGTVSPDFPATNPFGISTENNHEKIFVSKLDPAGALIYSTLLGEGKGIGIAVDSFGYAYIVGSATELPLVNSIQPFLNGLQDAFIAKLNPSGTALVYSTYLGGSGDDWGLSISVDRAGNAYVVGRTDSTTFPTHRPFQSIYGGGEADSFVVKLNASGSALVYSTYLGGSYKDIAADVTVDTAGNAYVVGLTNSGNFPTRNAFQPVHADPYPCPTIGVTDECSDAYVAKFSSSGVLSYSTFLGGDGEYDVATAVAVDPARNIYVAGYTTSTNFPTQTPYQTASPGYTSAFVTRFTPDGSALIFSTYLGGATGASLAYGLSIDGEGSVLVSGMTRATDFPTLYPIQTAQANLDPYFSDAFVTKFRADGQTLSFSTYLGGRGDEHVELDPRIAVDAEGNIYMTGSTSSDDFPLVHPIQNVLADDDDPDYTPFDAFIAKIAIPALSAPRTAPEPHLFVTHTPTLTWNRISGAQGYHLQVDRSRMFYEPLEYESYPDANTLADTTDWLDDGTYWWRVQALKADGTWSGWSAVQQFVIQSE